MICCVDYNPYNLLLAIEYRYKYCNGKKDNNTIPVDLIVVIEDICIVLTVYILFC